MEGRGGHLRHNMRLWETECAREHGIDLDDWYGINVISRETMVASMLADRYIDNVILEDSR